MKYICSFIFKELMQVDVEITGNVEQFKRYEGVRVNYSALRITDNELRIAHANLLFENDIQQQTIECFETNGYKAFFKIPAADFPFDIFAASFYLLSRYEEYLPHQKDMYGRYAHENSLAFKEGFLNLPMINIWVNHLAAKLHEQYSTFNIQHSTFRFFPTYDIDIAYSYRHKGLERTVGGFIKSPSAARLKVLAGTQQDPFDVYDWMDALHHRYSLKPIYFFLVAEKNGEYDKNILPGTSAMKELIAAHGAKYTVGIHPSWQSGDDEKMLKNEINLLKAILKKEITASRQHYIRFYLPDGYRRLIASGITEDYSMGYGSINGFRASVTASFYWYDLENEKQTGLRIHPFCFMDANSFYEQGLSAKEAYNELMQYYAVCKQVNGTLITIWHNNFLGSDPQFAGWKEGYEQFIAQVQQ
ncbi:MAG: polysaccharide deacetylase family protein [Chitinophagaceae bacterium]|nr:polysaccharide deacetylase family protein [Chitinophagaceae bacterium]